MTMSCELASMSSITARVTRTVSKIFQACSAPVKNLHRCTYSFTETSHR